MIIRQLEILVEERSAEMALQVLVPKIVPDLPFSVRVFDGKAQLLRQLPNRLKGYSTWAAANGVGIVVLVDRDSDD